MIALCVVACACACACVCACVRECVCARACSVFGCVVLMSTDHEAGNNRATGLNKFSMSNLAIG